MKKRTKTLFEAMSVCIIILMMFSACGPEKEVPGPVAAVTMHAPDLGIDLGALAEPIATLNIPWYKYLKYIFIPPGWFPLGSDEEEDKLARDDEIPQRNASLSGFWVGKSEVTNKEYLECVKSGVCTPPALRDSGSTTHYGNPAYDDHPVVGVNWNQSMTYCEWVDGRLPTEAEWEKAARSEMGFIYPWGNEAPTCDRANKNGCGGTPDTKTVGSYPLGASPFGLFDMAGNVREWTLDSYNPEGYITLARFNPASSEDTGEMVVRGGGYNDFDENLRTTARIALPPEENFDDVGFRCVPVQQEYATFCRESYRPPCYDPNIPRRPGDPCVPGQNKPGEGGVRILGVGCPWNGVVPFQVGTSGGGNSGYTATVNGVPFTCGPDPVGADVVSCSGPEQTMGQNAQIIVCAPGSTPPQTDESATSQVPANGILPASFTSFGRVSLMQSTAPDCPEGYIFNEESGECDMDPEREECPGGWHMDDNQRCVPDKPEEDCPPTTTFSANLDGCVPDEGDCPPGFYLTENKICEPDQNRQRECPPGYYFNNDVNCCMPIPRDNYGCEEGTYFNLLKERCLPIDDNGCGYGTTYLGYGVCGEDPDKPGPDDEYEGDCPPGLSAAAPYQCDPGEDTFGDENPAPGTLLRSGDVIGPNGLIVQSNDPNQPDCPEGYYPDAYSQRCIQYGDGGCPPGYYPDQEFGRCRPTNGPNSPCPIGFTYNFANDCCVPDPGTDSTLCPEDEYPPEQTGGSDGQQTAGTPGAAPYPGGVTPLSASLFNMQEGWCEEDDSTRNPGEPEDCPPNTYATNLGNCNQYPDGGVQDFDGEPDPEELKKLMADCPQGYWNENTNSCDAPQPDCLRGQYFDEQLGYCVPLLEDCCEIGQTFVAAQKECLPDATKPRNGICPDGYELIDDICWLIGTQEGGTACWTFTRNMPFCIGGCEPGLVRNAATGRCAPPPSSSGQSACPSRAACGNCGAGCSGCYGCP